MTRAGHDPSTCGELRHEAQRRHGQQRRRERLETQLLLQGPENKCIQAVCLYVGTRGQVPAVCLYRRERREALPPRRKKPSPPAYAHSQAYGVERDMGGSACLRCGVHGWPSRSDGAAPRDSRLGDSAKMSDSATRRLSDSGRTRAVTRAPGRVPQGHLRSHCSCAPSCDALQLCILMIPSMHLELVAPPVENVIHTTGVDKAAQESGGHQSDGHYKSDSQSSCSQVAMVALLLWRSRSLESRHQLQVGSPRRVCMPGAQASHPRVRVRFIPCPQAQVSRARGGLALPCPCPASAWLQHEAVAGRLASRRAVRQMTTLSLHPRHARPHAHA